MSRHQILKNIEEIRRNKGVPQEELIKSIGISQSAYARFESGQTRLDFNLIEEIAQFWNLSFWELYHYHNPDLLNQEPIAKKEAEYLKQKVLLLEELIENKNEIISLLKQTIPSNTEGQMLKEPIALYNWFGGREEVERLEVVVRIDVF